MIIVDWKEDHLNCVTCGELKPFILKPGTNYVPEKKWKEMKKHLKEKINNGSIELSVDEKTTSFKEIDPQDAERIINKCICLDSLEKWKDEETRDEIRSIIKDRIDVIEKFIKTGKKPKDKKKNKGRR